MSREPLVDVDEVMFGVEKFSDYAFGESVVAGDMRDALEDVVERYESALRFKRTGIDIRDETITRLGKENADLRKRLADLERVGLDASISDGDTIDEWKERCWRAEQENAKHMRIAEKSLVRFQEQQTENADLRKRLEKAIHIIQVREDMCEGANEAIAMYKKRIAELEAQNTEPEPTPGFFNAENMDYLKNGLDVTHRRIDKLADRIAELEREQRRCEGEI